MELHKFDSNYDDNILRITSLGQINRYKFAIKVLENSYEFPVNVLDAACGYGIGSDILAKSNLTKEILGIDLDPECIEKANQRYSNSKITFKVSDLEDKIDTNKTFGLIASMETIEHVDKPVQFLKNIYEVTDKNGLLVMATPNGENTNEEAWKYRRTDEDKNLLKGTIHVKEYTRAEMREIISESGFKLQKEFGLFVLFGYALRMTNIKPDSSTNSEGEGRIQKILDKIPLVPEVFSKPYPFLVGSAKNVIYVAKKE